MAAAPLDLTSDMAAIAEHHQEGIRLHREGGFTEEEWSEHQRITYVALMVLGVDGMQRVARACLLEGAAEPVDYSVNRSSRSVSACCTPAFSRRVFHSLNPIRLKAVVGLLTANSPYTMRTESL